LRLQELRTNAMKILSNIPPFLGKDTVELILQTLSNRDFVTLNAVCKVESNSTPKPTISNISLPNPSSSINFGFYLTLFFH
jgi:hypothetical protein